MAPIVSSIDVTQPCAVAFDYAVDPTHFHEWQSGVVPGQRQRESTAVGSRCYTTRTVGGRAREMTSEITASDPPRHWAEHGVDGPVRGIVDVNVEPLDDDTRSRVTISLDFEGHGIGKLLIPLVVRRQAEREMPENMRRFKVEVEKI